MKNKGLMIFLIITFITIFICFVSFIFFITVKRIDLKNVRIGKKSELVIDEIYDTDFEKISILSNAMDINIKVSDNNKTRLVIYGEKKSTKIDTEDDELTIKMKNKPKTNLFCINCQQDKVLLYLPKTFANEIIFESVAGDINIESLPYANVEIKASAGDIDIKELSSLNLKASAGDIDIGKVNSLIIEALAGDISIGEIDEYLSFSGKSGAVNISKLYITNDSKIDMDYGEIKIKETSDVFVDASVKAGEIKINNNDRFAKTELKIRLKAGEIKVIN